MWAEPRPPADFTASILFLRAPLSAGLIKEHRGSASYIQRIHSGFHWHRHRFIAGTQNLRSNSNSLAPEHNANIAREICVVKGLPRGMRMRGHAVYSMAAKFRQSVL